MAGKKLLFQRLAHLDLRAVEIGDDGNCQFRAFSQQLFGDQAFHFPIRREVVAAMRREASFFGAMFAEGELDTCTCLVAE